MNRPSTIIRRPATYQDVLDAPAHLVAELIHGALHLHPRPAARHARASFKLAARLDDPYDRGSSGPGGWLFLIEPELHLDAEVLVPDLAGWRRTRMPHTPGTSSIDLAPDWVCEILSPATRTYDTTEKRDIYAAHGVEYLWFIDPEAHTLEAFARRDAAWLLLANLHDDAPVRVAPFEATSFPLSDLWPE